jgi:hypothetical protein
MRFADNVKLLVIGFFIADHFVTFYTIFSEYSTHYKIDQQKDSITYKIKSEDTKKAENKIEMVLIVNLQF